MITSPKSLLCVMTIVLATAVGCIKFDPGTAPGVTPTRRILSGERFVQITRSESQFDPIGCVGPFDPGKTELANSPRQTDIESNPSHRGESCTDSSKIARILAAQSRCPDNMCLKLLILVGSADKRDLHLPLRNAYGSNEGLARARAEWVSGQIIQRMPENSTNRLDTPLILTIGPHIHEKLGGNSPRMKWDAMAPDRSVSVWAVWDVKTIYKARVQETTSPVKSPDFDEHAALMKPRWGEILSIVLEILAFPLVTLDLWGEENLTNFRLKILRVFQLLPLKSSPPDTSWWQALLVTLFLVFSGLTTWWSVVSPDSFYSGFGAVIVTVIFATNTAVSLFAWLFTVPVLILRKRELQGVMLWVGLALFLFSKSIPLFHLLSEIH